jgi:hypothetical protein
MRKFFKEIFSENGRGSSKRIVGAIAYLVALFCVIWLTLHEGGTIVVEGLISTLIVSASALLGLTSIANIFKKKE